AVFVGGHLPWLERPALNLDDPGVDLRRELGAPVVGASVVVEVEALHSLDAVEAHPLRQVAGFVSEDGADRQRGPRPGAEGPRARAGGRRRRGGPHPVPWGGGPPRGGGGAPPRRSGSAAQPSGGGWRRSCSSAQPSSDARRPAASSCRALFSSDIVHGVSPG